MNLLDLGKQSWLIAVLAAFILTACAVNSVTIRDQLSQNAWQDALAEIDSTYGDEPVLYGLQAGTALHRAGDYAASNQALAGIAAAMEELRGLSVTETASSALVNDNTRSYEATDFEMAAGKILQILNYLALNNLEAARVEAMQANALLDELEAEGKFAFIHVLTGMVLEMTGEYDNALVSYRKAIKDYEAQRADGRDVSAPEVVRQAYADLLLRMGLDDELQRSGLQAQELPAANPVQVFGIFSGSMVSARVDSNIQHYSVEAGKNFALSIPHYPERQAPGFRPNTSFKNGLLTSMEQQQRAALSDLRPGIITRTAARLLAKHQTQALAEREGGELAGLVVGFANNITEQADTRSADLLPAQMYFVREIMSVEELNQRVLLNQAAFQELDDAKITTHFALVDRISGVRSGNPTSNHLIIISSSAN